jgi:hypothetical protein
MADDRIRDKIRALLAKTKPDSGCTEEEAASAMSMAAMMMTKYGIQMSLEDLEHEPSGWSGRTERANYMKWHLYCAEASAYLYYCRPFIWTFPEGYSFEFIGRPDNTDAAKQTFLWLVDQVESLYKQHLPPGLSKSLRAELRRTFKLACAARIRGRAWRLIEELTSNDALALPATGSTALVIQKHAETLIKEAEQALDDKMPDRRQLQIRPSKVGVGTQMGLMAGDRVELQKGVELKRKALPSK